MLVLDRVFCDLCGEPMGQLFNQPASAPDLLPDTRMPPYMCACPLCWESSEIVHVEDVA